MGASHRRFQPEAFAQSATARVMVGVASVAARPVKVKPVSHRYVRKEAVRVWDSPAAVGSWAIR